MEMRAQVAYHFKFDPAQLIPGAVRLPEHITRTVTVGSELRTEKVSSACLPAADQGALLEEMEKQVQEATRTARPAGAAAETKSEPEDEMSAF
jgi:hypothetical protein